MRDDPPVRRDVPTQELRTSIQSIPPDPVEGCYVRFSAPLRRDLAIDWARYYAPRWGTGIDVLDVHGNVIESFSKGAETRQDRGEDNPPSNPSPPVLRSPIPPQIKSSGGLPIDRTPIPLPVPRYKKGKGKRPALEVPSRFVPAVRLAMRSEGGTAAELNQVTGEMFMGWTATISNYANRLGKKFKTSKRDGYTAYHIC